MSFQHAGAALSTSNGAAPATFEVAGDDGVFHPADARLSGKSVVVISASVRVPGKVSYGWQSFLHGNLVNAAGLPASTFLLEAK